MYQKNEYLYVAASPQAIKQFKENAHAYLGLGLAFIALGTLAIIFAFKSTILSVVFFGALMFIAGCIEGAKAISVHHWSTFFLHLFLSIIYVVAGIFIIFNPAVNAVSLTLLLAIFFVISGILKIIFAIANDLPHKTWLIINGILSLVLGILIWRQWPASGLWVLGTFLGIDMIFTGWSWVVLSLAAKKLKKS